MEKVTSVTTILGLLIKEARVKKGVTQAGIARKFGITSAGWGKLENGKTALTIEHISFITNTLSLDMVLLINELNDVIKYLKNNNWTIENHRVENDSLIIGWQLSRIDKKFDSVLCLNKVDTKIKFKTPLNISGLIKESLENIHIIIAHDTAHAAPTKKH